MLRVSHRIDAGGVGTEVNPDRTLEPCAMLNRAGAAAVVGTEFSTIMDRGSGDQVGRHLDGILRRVFLHVRVSFSGWCGALRACLYPWNRCARVRLGCTSNRKCSGPSKRLMKSAQKVLKNDIADPLEIGLAAMP